MGKIVIFIKERRMKILSGCDSLVRIGVSIIRIRK